MYITLANKNEWNTYFKQIDPPLPLVLLVVTELKNQKIVISINYDIIM